MKKVISLFTGAFLLLVVIFPAQAQTPRPLRDRVTDFQQKREGIQEKVGERRQEMRCHVAGVHQERLTKRFGVYDKRLSNMIEKVQGWIDRLSEKGSDLTNAQSKLDEAKTKLDDANDATQASIDGFGVIDEENCNGQRDQALSARDSAQGARALFKDALQLLKEAFRIVKAEIPTSDGE